MSVKECDGGCTLPVRAQPGARRNGIVGIHQGSLKVAVTAPPEDGKANRALIETLAQELGLKRSQVELIKGQGNREKTFLIRGLTKAELESRLVSALSH